MRQFVYENQGTNTYLVYKIEEEDVLDTMSLGMLTNNKIPGLASAFFTQMDSDKYIKYNISSKISVKQFFVGAINKKRLLGVFKGIVNALLSAEDYMIDEKSILIDLDYIYADVSTCETILICLPIHSDVEAYDLGTFFKTIMFTAQFDQTENCDYVARIMNYLNSNPLFSLYDFKNMLDTIENANSNESKQHISVKPVESVTQTVQQPVVQQTVVTVNDEDKKPPVKQPSVTPPITTGQQVEKTNKQQTQTVEDKTVSAEKEISWFYLMQHYNKENAAAYKAQKEAKKNTTKATVPAQAQLEKKPAQNKPSFAVPGQSGNPGFAIPGQEVPVNKVTVPAQQTVQPVPVQQVPTNGQSTTSPTPAYVPREGTGNPNFGETSVLGGGSIGETSVLKVTNTPKQVVAPHLIRTKNNEKISLNKPVFRVGKERSYVDYFIGDNTAVSRSHANIITRDGEYFVVDMNSTNHTFVNGEMISSSVEVKIEHGAKLMFGNEEFEFKAY